MSGIHINPDHFLQTDSGRVITPELNQRAWEMSYLALDNALVRATARTTLYVLVGPQGAGKSTWSRALIQSDPQAVVFDAILVKKSERQIIIRAASAYALSRIAVWFKTPLDMCLARNAARPHDEVVPERAIRNVHAAIEPPTTDEGFDSVIEVRPVACDISE